MQARMDAPTVRAENYRMLSSVETQRLLGLTRDKFSKLLADADAKFPEPYTFSTSGRGWRFFRQEEVVEWLASRRG
jgi:predicted DNA-binding transcriptional regulator AlpA